MNVKLHADDVEKLLTTQVFFRVGLCGSHNDAIRCARQGGLRMGNRKVEPGEQFPLDWFLFEGEPQMLYRGKKKRILLEITWEDRDEP